MIPPSYQTNPRDREGGRLTHVSLFSGIGGIDLAAHWAGFETVAFVERDAYCQKVLAKHWPGVPIYDDVTTFDGLRYRGVDLLSGGFPCQPYSHAGKRLGADDDRALWPAMRGVVRAAHPAWVLGENVAGFVGMGLDSCISDLENEGYEVWPILLPACGVGAPHRRYRVFIVAHSRSGGCDSGSMLRPGTETGRAFAGHSGATMEDTDRRRLSEPGIRSQQSGGTEVIGAGQVVADAARYLLSGAEAQRAERERVGERGEPIDDANHDGPARENFEGCAGSSEPDGRKVAIADPIGRGPNQWESEPRLGRVAHGVPHRVDRLRALGNAVVPQQVYPILKAIAEQLQGAAA